MGGDAIRSIADAAFLFFLFFLFFFLDKEVPTKKEKRRKSQTTPACRSGEFGRNQPANLFSVADSAEW